MVTLTFGKHKGKHLSEIPTDYLRWCLCECHTCGGFLRSQILQELEGRAWDAGESANGGKSYALQDNLPDPSKRLVADEHKVLNGTEIIRRWHRDMLLKFHPDHGGTDEGAHMVSEGLMCFYQLAELQQRQKAKAEAKQCSTSPITS